MELSEPDVRFDVAPPGWRQLRRPDAAPGWIGLPFFERAEPVKTDGRVRVVRWTGAGRTLYAKWLRSDDPAGRWRYGWRCPRARTNFRVAAVLSARGLRVVPHWAAGWRRRGGWVADSVLVTEAPPGTRRSDERLLEELAPGNPHRRAWLAAGAEWLAQVHRAGVIPHDLKATNILVRDGPPDADGFILLDLDNCRTRGWIWPWEVARNMAQLRHSFRRVAGRRDHLWFVLRYAAARGWNRLRLRRWLSRFDRRLRRG